MFCIKKFLCDEIKYVDKVEFEIGVIWDKIKLLVFFNCK